MALVDTPICNFGEVAHYFSLRGTDGHIYDIDAARGENGLLVIFMCNHCPYVLGVIERLVEDAKILQNEGIGVIGIMPNDVESYPADNFENMKKFAKEYELPFPYVIDDTQAIAKAYGAVCTPDFFGYNSAMELQYRGRLDKGKTEPIAADSKRELLEAMIDIAKTGKGPEEQIPSMGCSIKWK